MDKDKVEEAVEILLTLMVSLALLVLGGLVGATIKCLLQYFNK